MSLFEELYAQGFRFRLTEGATGIDDMRVLGVHAGGEITVFSAESEAAEAERVLVFAGVV